MHILNTPLKESDILNLNAGDNVLLNGTIFTARDKAHLFLLEEDFPAVKNGIIYHAGPIIKGREVISAGPTTSARLNPYTPKLIKKYGIKAIIGKGGMNQSVVDALRGRAVYFSAIGGAGVLYAEAMKLKNVYKEEFGMPEAIWEFEVENFPVIVAIDAKGKSLYNETLKKSGEVFAKLV
ncbi:MAG: FumA C-terminus/TtdB family hydratase beta subunit [Patescibacteria group bacterium]|jgi:fumarate hydratase subunit beta